RARPRGRPRGRRRSDAPRVLSRSIRLLPTVPGEGPMLAPRLPGEHGQRRCFVRGLSFGAIAAAASVVIAGVTGCGSCSKSSGAKTEARATATSSPSNVASAPSAMASAPEGGGGGARHEMGNCPTAVSGADVAIKDVDGGVEVAVTGKDDTTAS